MNWYYSNNGEKVGPLSETDFSGAVSTGKVVASTLVWNEGLPDWVPYSQSGHAAAGTGGATLDDPTAPGVCAECGRSFPRGEMANFAGRLVCAACKPAYVQKLKEGVAPAGEWVYAGFWTRFAAKFVDGIILRVLGLVIGMVVGALVGAGEEATAIASGLGFLAGTVVQVAYGAFFVGKFAATPGKMATKVKVVRSNGEPVTYARATGRVFAEILSGMILGIGYLMAAWDPEKRALHDRICDTRVIRQ